MPPRISRRALLAAGATGGALSALEAFALFGSSGAERAAAAMSADRAGFTGVGRSGLYLQTGTGDPGDFALTIPNLASGTVTTQRLNSIAADGTVWSPLHWTSGTASGIDGVSATWSNYGHLETAQVVDGAIQTWWRSASDDWTRSGDVPVTNGPARGWPSLVQTSYGVFGDFHLAVPLEGGGIMHAQRLNDLASVWRIVTRFGSGRYQGVALIQPAIVTPGGTGDLELVAVTAAGQLEAWRWNPGGGWFRSATFGDGFTGGPALAQGTVGTSGDLEVVAPLAAGGLKHWSRDNDRGQTWLDRGLFGSPERFSAAGLIAGPFGPATNINLEAAGYGLSGVSVFSRDSSLKWTTLTSPRRVPHDPPRLGSVDGTVDIGALGILSTLLPTGDLLLIGYKPANQYADADYRLFHPATRSVQTLPFRYDTFCAGMDVAADGTVLIAGGHSPDAIAGVFLIDPERGNLRRYPNMPLGRWYPTVTTLADGRTLVMAGSLVLGVNAARNSTYQVWNPVTRTMSGLLDTPVPFSSTWPATDVILHWYPVVLQLPDGRLMVHSRSTTRMLTDVDRATWSGTAYESAYGLDRTYPHSGSPVILPLRHTENYAFEVLLAGGTSGDAPANAAVPASTPATATAEIFTPDKGWRRTASMFSARVLHDCVLLPDGTVMAVGGGAVGHNDVVSRPVMYAEIFDPVSETWTTAGEITVPRGYHGTAVLLPDGSVAIAGRDPMLQPSELQYIEHRLEVFKPTYFFKGTRPTLTGVPQAMVPGGSYSASFTVASGSTLVDVVLMRAGSVTHGNNMGQRLLTVPFTVSGGRVSFTLPANANLLPPGGYLIAVVDSAGRPSPAQLSRLTPPGAVVAPWRSFASIPARITRSGEQVSLSAAGADIWFPVDDFAAVYTPVAVGPGGSVTAKLELPSNSAPWAKAGVFLRNDITSPGRSAGYAVMVATPGNGVAFQWDANGDGYLDTLASAAIGTKTPVWLRLTRVGATRVAGHYSTDGSTWTQAGPTVTLAGAAARQDAGALMTAHTLGSTGTAVVSNLQIT